MRTIGLSLALLLAAAPAAQAGPFGFGGFGHHGGGRGHFGGFGGFGLFGYYDAETAQSRFETKLEDLQADYDDGVSNIGDYYNSDEYMDLVDDTEWLSDKYDWFLTGVETQIDWLGLSITHLTDESDFLDELLAKYEADEDLSEERLARLTGWVTRAQDFLTLKIDLLTEKQTTLSDNLPTYQAFGEEITVFLDTIVAAGGGTSTTETEETDTTATAIAIAATAMTQADGSSTTTEESTPSAVAITAVPEPATVALLILALGGAFPRRMFRARCAA